MVKPPQKPVARSRRISVDSSSLLPLIPAITPIARHPARFEARVPHGRLNAEMLWVASESP